MTATQGPTMIGLCRVRRGVRLALALGIGASIGANVLHADPNAISRIIAAWPPAALAITVELVSRVPATSRWLSVVRITGTAIVAIIAAMISYMHMRGVAIAYGETGLSATIIPLSVDGMIVVASVCLVEIGARIEGTARTVATEPATVPMSQNVRSILPDALTVAHEIIPNGTPPSGRALAEALRRRGHHVAARDVAPLRDAVAARWTAPGGGRT